jgi:hypothetical protein
MLSAQQRAGDKLFSKKAKLYSKLSRYTCKKKKSGAILTGFQLG